MLVAVVSDTHVGDALPALPISLLENLDFRRPDLIIHAGDITKPHVLTKLETIAETVAVKGDNDDPKEFTNFSLPDYWKETVQGHVIVVTHGDRTKEKEAPSRKINGVFARLHLPFRWWNGYFQDLYDRFASLKPDLILCGHLHHPSKRSYKNSLIVNPGGVYQNGSGTQRNAFSSIVYLHLQPQIIEVEFVILRNTVLLVSHYLERTVGPAYNSVRSFPCAR